MSHVGARPEALRELGRTAGPAADDLRRAASNLAGAVQRWNDGTEPDHALDDVVSDEVHRLATALVELDGWAGRVGDALEAADASGGRGVAALRLARLYRDRPSGGRVDELVADLVARLEHHGRLTRGDLVGLEVDDLSAAGQRSELSPQARDLVNRTAIARWLRTQPGPAELAAGRASQDTRRRLAALRALVGEDGPTRELAGLLAGAPLTVLRFVSDDGPDGEPTLQLFRGDPTAVEHVVVWVPGTTNGVHTLDAQLLAARRLQQRARQLPGRPELGVLIDLYDAPDTILLGRSNAARSAHGAHHAVALQAAVGDARRLADDGNVLLLGHSYGSYAAGHAAALGVDADDVAFVGSPGVGVGHADDLALADGGQVHVGRAPKDPIDLAADLDEEVWPGTTAVALGPDPADADFGGRVFEVNLPEVAPGDPGYASGHSDYLRPGSQSLRNLATIAVGGTPTRARDSDVGERLDEVDAVGPGFLDGLVARSRPEYYGGTDVTRAEDGP